MNKPQGSFAGASLASIDPSNGAVIWRGVAAGPEQCAAAIASARAAFRSWSVTSLSERRAIAQRFKDVLKQRMEEIARDISRETGKPLWETKTEVASMIGKVDISIAAQNERAGEREQALAFGRAVLRHRPHGVMLVLGPYNFPGHLPNGHIVPALLAGDTVVFKPSEETPLTGEHMAAAWREAGLPEGVFNLVQGGRETGAALIEGEIDGLLFTGSASAGAHFRRVMIDRPEVILALELGGNNPLIAWNGDPVAMASIIVQSGFVTTGQRCSCARRLIIPEGPLGDRIITAVLDLTARLRIGTWDDAEEPFMGPLVSITAANRALGQYQGLLDLGVRVIRPLAPIAGKSAAFVSPGLVDVTGIDVPDEEIFAPLLQVRRVPDFDAAIAAANDTRYGLSAGVITADDALWERYVNASRAGVVNRNRPTTGAAGSMPFGGLGASGNHRPSAYYAADYCAYPVASFEAAGVADQTGDIKGLLLA